ncbi:MAG: energy transducer TonB [Candidatus Obscuribacterales bacterium]|nr:energy transducer TonB [Candidatus Obscuribacterales bacterium]
MKLFYKVLLLVIAFYCGSYADAQQNIQLASHAPGYRDRLLYALAETWTRENGPITEISIAPDGTLAWVVVIESSGDDKLDKQALDAIKQMRLPALPEWTKVRPLTKPIAFYFNMSKLHTGNIKDAVFRPEPARDSLNRIVTSPVCTSQSGRRLTVHIKTVRQNIASWWESAGFHTGAPIVQIDIQADGAIRNVRIIQSTNSPNIDQAIVEKLQAVRFKPCPEIAGLASDHGLRMTVDLQTGETPPEYRSIKSSPTIDSIHKQVE